MTFTVLFVYIVLFFFTFNQAVFLPQFTSFSDEVFTIITFFIFLLFLFTETKQLRFKKIIVVFVLYFIYNIIQLFFSPFTNNWIYSFIQSIINIKYIFVTYIFIRLLLKSKKTHRQINCLLLIFGILFVIGMILNMVLQESWNSLLGYKIEYRYSILRPAGWLASIAHNSYFFIYALLVFFFPTFLKKKTNISRIMTFLLFSLVIVTSSYIFTVRKNILVLVPLFIFVINYISRKYRFYLSIIVVSACIFLVAANFNSQMVQDTLQNITDTTNNSEENSYIRGIMIYNGVYLFLHFFPFGTGAATYGTLMSLANTHEVYKFVGIPEMFYLQEKTLGIYDSGFFSFIGENGFLGLLLVFFIHIYLVKKIRCLLPPVKYHVFLVLLSYAVFLSITEPVWQNGLFTVFFVLSVAKVIDNKYLRIVY